jgi:phospholipid/cholesterol/gamma-HCH transport system substrate-binding protein
MKKDWRERELTMEIVVGAFVVMIMLGLGYFTIILSKETWFSDKTEMHVTFMDVMGLRDGDSVVVRGMPIGKVKELKLAESESCSGVCVTLMLDNELTMHEGYEMKIISTSILGGRQLHIDEGPFDAEVVDLDIYRGKDPYDIMEDAADIVNAARTEIISGSVFKNIRNITDHINDMVMRVNNGEGLLGAALNDDSGLSRDVESSMKSLKVVLGRVEDGKGVAGQLVAENSEMQADLKASMTAVRKILERIEHGDGTIGKLVADDATLYSDLSEAVASFRNIAARIDKGEGTIGRFVTDDTLYNEVEATVGEIRATIDDFRETAPITAFSSIFFGAF